MIQQTSLLAYQSILDDLSRRQKEVLEILGKHDGMTNKEIARALRLDINSITPRTNELVKRGIVYDSKERRSDPDSKSSAIIWKLKNVGNTLF